MATDKLINSSQGDQIISALGGGQGASSIATSLATIAAKSNTPYNSDNKLHAQFTDLPTYSKESSSKSIQTTDSVTSALGKLEYKTDQNASDIATNTNNISYNTDMGVKNLINIRTGTEIVNGVTFTFNADKTVTVSGTATGGAANLNICSFTADEAYALNGKILSGCPANGSDNTYKMQLQRNSSPWNVYAKDTGNETTISGVAQAPCILLISIAEGQTVNLTFKPMIRQFGDNTYQPYALSNAELTAKEQQNESDILTGLTLVAHTSANGTTSLTFDTNINDFNIGGANSDKSSGSYLVICTNWSTTPAPYVGLLTFSGATSNKFVKTDVVTGFTPTITITQNTSNATIAISGAAKISIYATK